MQMRAPHRRRRALGSAVVPRAWYAGTHKLVQYGTGKLVAPQLFDLARDPAEMNNLCVPPLPTWIRYI